jgi:hypothetical protein
MKTSSNVSLLFAFVAIVWTSCSDKDNNTTPKITAPVGKMNAKIDGTALELTAGAQVYGNQIIVGASSTSTETMSIFVTIASKTGTYNTKGVTYGTGEPDAEINYSLNNDFYSSVYAAVGDQSGKVTITEIDETNKTISGTFSGKVFVHGTSKTITDGSFNKILYEETPESILTAKIDGTAFSPILVNADHVEGVITVAGFTLNGSRRIDLNFSEQIQPGTYTIGGPNDAINAAYTINLSPIVSSSGTLTITKNDQGFGRVEGTFSFKTVPSVGGSDNHNIAEGTFAATYY